MSPAIATTPSSPSSTMPRLHEHFTESLMRMRLHIAPAFAANIMEGVRAKLSGLLMNYDEEVKGVVLAYSDVVLEPPVSGRIMYDSPFIHVSLRARVLAFAPVIGSSIIGQVKKQSRDHLALHVYSAFNASIPASAIRSDFVWNEQAQKWTERSSGRTIDEDALVTFTISQLTVDNHMLVLGGTMMDAKQTGLSMDVLNRQAKMLGAGMPLAPAKSESSSSSPIAVPPSPPLTPLVAPVNAKPTPTDVEQTTPSKKTTSSKKKSKRSKHDDDGDEEEEVKSSRKRSAPIDEGAPLKPKAKSKKQKKSR